MSTENKNLESGAVGQPGESTTPKANNLTSNGISSLLNSEFAKEDTAEAKGKETPPRARQGAGANDGGKTAEERNHEQEQAEKELAERAEAAGKSVEDQRADEAAEATEQTRLEAKATELGKSVEEVQALEAEEAKGAGEALPPEMQSALDEWEAKGGPLPDSVQRVVNKRIGRLTEEKVAAETRANGLEAELKTAKAEAEALRNDPNRPAQPNPYGLPDAQDLAKTERAARKFLDEAEAYLDDTATPQERERMDRFMNQSGLDANGLKRRVREINGYLRDELPAQKEAVRNFKTQEQQFTTQARRDFAWLSDPKAPEHAVKAEMLKLLPDLPKRLANHELVMGIYMLGYKQYEAQLKAAGTKGKPAAAAKTTPPPKTPAGVGAARQAAARPKASDTASEAFSKAPTRDNAVNLARAALTEA